MNVIFGYKLFKDIKKYFIKVQIYLLRLISESSYYTEIISEYM